MSLLDSHPFPLLEDSLEGFDRLTLLSCIRDPGYGYGHVFMFLLRFHHDRSLGVCIWDSDAMFFIEEPQTFHMWGTSQAEFKERYPSLFREAGL